MKPLSDPRDADVAVSESRAPERGEGTIDTRLLPRGASEGPLKDLIPVFVDIETFVSDTVSLDSMTLRQYFRDSYLTMIALAVGVTDPVEAFYTPKNLGPAGSPMVTEELCQTLRWLAMNPQYVFVAHNAAFDMRGLRFLLGVPHPINVWCTMEGAMGAWPEMPGGFSLSNLAKRMRLPADRCKLELDLLRLQKLTDKCPLPADRADELIVSQIKKILVVGSVPWPTDGVLTRDLCQIVLAIYNRRDVEAMRDIFMLQAARLPALEQGVGLRTHHQRRHHFRVDSSKLDEFVDKMDENAAYAEKEVEAMVDTGDLRAVFNRDNDNGMLTSIRYARLKKLVNAKLANEQFESTSLKKISPVQLARNPLVYALLQQTTRAGKMMSHKRRAKIFAGVTEVDVELGAWRAHTGRFSSPSVGKGLNLHNCVSVFSLVLSQRGWVSILALNKEDTLWDGIEFVAFDRVTSEGSRSTIKVGAADLTPEHPVWTGEQKLDAGSLTLCQQVQCVAGGLSSSLRGLLATGSASVALDAAQKLYVWFRTSTRHSDAEAALIAEALGTSCRALRVSPSSSNGAGSIICVTGTTAKPTQASRRLTGNRTTSGLVSVKHGWLHRKPTMCTFKRFLVGMTRLFKSIAGTTTEGTNPGTSASLLLLTTSATAAVLSGHQPERSSQLTATGSALGIDVGTTFSDTAVFDIREVGPRARFTTNGLLTFNCPKHDKAIAEPVRKLFKVPPDLCLVRGDLANVEYRIEGYLTQCQAVFKMFDPAKGGDIFTDPYSAGWKTMTGMSITKKDPVRQVAKSATLGLGFIMSPPGYAKVLLNVLADKKSGVTEEILRDIIVKNNWKNPDSDRVKKIVSMLGCPQTVALSAYHIHRLFNDAHPEFKRTAYWLVRLVERVASTGGNHDQAKRAIDEMYDSTSAPDRNLINMEIDDDPIPLYASVRACCGPWPRTVCWREPYMRKVDFAGSDSDKKLTIRKATGEYKIFTPQLAIENITQAAARNALCMGVANLEKMGFLDVIHVHDEIMILCKRDRNTVLAARDALVTCFGPAHTMPYAWSILVKPDEITLTESLYEDENDILRTTKNKDGLEVPGPDRWGRIERDEPGCLLYLP